MLLLVSMYYCINYKLYYYFIIIIVLLLNILKSKDLLYMGVYMLRLLLKPPSSHFNQHIIRCCIGRLLSYFHAIMHAYYNILFAPHPFHGLRSLCGTNYPPGNDHLFFAKRCRGKDKNECFNQMPSSKTLRFSFPYSSLPSQSTGWLMQVFAFI